MAQEACHAIVETEIDFYLPLLSQRLVPADQKDNQNRHSSEYDHGRFHAIRPILLARNVSVRGMERQSLVVVVVAINFHCDRDLVLVVVNTVLSSLATTISKFEGTHYCSLAIAMRRTRKEQRFHKIELWIDASSQIENRQNSCSVFLFNATPGELSLLQHYCIF